jgi:hypothetical protein
MPVPYDKVTTSNQDLNQVQANIARAFQAVPDPVSDGDGIVTVDTASGTKTFLIPESCKNLVCLTNGNALTVSLPSPATKRTVFVVCAGNNPVTVQRQDGQTSAWGQSLTLAKAESRLFVANGTTWS